MTKKTNKSKKDPAKSRAITIGKRQDKIRQELLEELKTNPIISSACYRVGINPATYYRWLKDDSDFAKESKEAMRLGVLLISDMAASKVIQGIKSGIPSFVMFWLKCRSREFVEKETHTHVHEVKPDLLTNEKLETIKQALEGWRDPNVNKKVRVIEPLIQIRAEKPDNEKKSESEKQNKPKMQKSEI